MKVPTIYYHDYFCAFEREIEAGAQGRRRYAKGELVPTVSGIGSVYHYIRSGQVSLSMNNEAGYRKLLLIMGPGAIFPVFRNNVNYKTNHTIEFQVMEDFEADVVSEAGMSEILQKNQPFLMKTLNYALDILDLYTYDAANAVYNDSLSAVCNFLYLLWLQVPEAQQKGIIRISHEDIASATGHSRPQVSKLLSLLCRENILATGRGTIRVLNPAALENYCSYDVKEDP